MDFDGVIKESLEIKTLAFKKLFSFNNDTIIKKIIDHHLKHSGVSRYEKIPLYLKWSNKEINQDNVNKFTTKFANIVKNEVINSNWVLGAEEYIKNNKYDQNFYLITGTPQDEIEHILQKLDIKTFFSLVFGSPKKKKDSINEIINLSKLDRNKCLMIGDSLEDFNAAKLNDISFLREHSLNKVYLKTIMEIKLKIL